MLAYSGRLSPFVPISDDHGIDLIALDKANQRSEVKSAVANPKRKTVQFDVQKSTYRPAPDHLLLAVLFEPTTVSGNVVADPDGRCAERLGRPIG